MGKQPKADAAKDYSTPAEHFKALSVVIKTAIQCARAAEQSKPVSRKLVKASNSLDNALEDYREVLLNMRREDLELVDSRIFGRRGASAPAIPNDD